MVVKAKARPGTASERDIPRWSDVADADHPILWESAGSNERAYLSWEGALGRLVPNWFDSAEALRTTLEGGHQVRTPFAYYRMVGTPVSVEITPRGKRMIERQLNEQ